MDASNPIVFYDIASGPPVRTYAPNPWKTRYALNFKGVHYRTEWVELLDVTATRKRLGVPANRKWFMDGSDFHTLPIIQDLSNNGKLVGDSFEIADYLDKQYQDGPQLLPSKGIALYKAFNVQIDAIFTKHVLLFTHGMPLNPATKKETTKAFEDRMKGMPWESMTITGEARTAEFASLQSALEELAKTYRYTEGLFLEGDTPSYADLILGAWLQMAKITINDQEWEHMCTWHYGLWGQLDRALERYAEIK